MIAQEHVHIQYRVSFGGFDGVAALYDNLGYQIGANPRRKKENSTAGFFLHFKISSCLCLKCVFWQVKKLAGVFVWQHFYNATGLEQVSGTCWINSDMPTSLNQAVTSHPLYWI